MPARLKRSNDTGYLHFITTSWYQRRPLLATSARRDLFLRILEETRGRYGFAVVGYVVMPEHVHLLISEPETGTPSTVMQVVKQRFAREQLRLNPRLETRETWGTRRLEEAHVWQRRYYDFVVWKSGKTPAGAGTRPMAMEQLPILRVWGAWAGID